jgi:hypothetical protein
MTPSESGELTSSAQRKNAWAEAKHLGKRRAFQNGQAALSMSASYSVCISLPIDTPLVVEVVFEIE